MDYFRPADERGLADFGWLHSRHSFSFGAYHDPQHMGFSVLRVINDDTVQGGAGFDTHGHQNMEIISYVLEGSIEHQDSMGNQYTVPAGDIQVMSAGSGVRHSEYNCSPTVPLKFLQIWIEPNRQNIEPNYQQASIQTLSSQPLTALVTSDGRDESLMMQQDANLYRLTLKPAHATADELNHHHVDLSIPSDRCGYLHVIDGELRVNDQLLQPGDALGLGLNDSKPQQLEIYHVAGHAKALWFDLPR